MPVAPWSQRWRMQQDSDLKREEHQGWEIADGAHIREAEAVEINGLYCQLVIYGDVSSALLIFFATCPRIRISWISDSWGSRALAAMSSEASAAIGER